jgi:hypothetical protein
LLDQAGPEGLDLESPEVFQDYFRLFYDLSKVTEGWDKVKEAIDGRDFPRLAASYRLIDTDAIEVLVPYDLETYQARRREVAERGWADAAWRRRAQPHTVSPGTCSSPSTQAPAPKPANAPTGSCCSTPKATTASGWGCWR